MFKNLFSSVPRNVSSIITKFNINKLFNKIGCFIILIFNVLNEYNRKYTIIDNDEEEEVEVIKEEEVEVIKEEEVVIKEEEVVVEEEEVVVEEIKEDKMYEVVAKVSVNKIITTKDSYDDNDGIGWGGCIIS